jgi:hypothetical protein
MRNRTLRTAGRREFIPSRQLCNSLLHNWFLKTHPPSNSLYINMMQQASELP